MNEAYHEFSGRSAAPLLREFDNLVVLRTFSKAMAMAGLRVGYLLADPALVREINKARLPYNLNFFSQAAALAALEDPAPVREGVARIVSARQELFRRLAHVAGVRPYPSQANFILCSVLKGQASRIHQELRRRGILVRYFDTPILRECLRISVGKPEHTHALVAALSGIC